MSASAIDWDRLDAPLRRLAPTLPATRIAAALGVSDRSVRDRLRQLGLAARAAGRPACPVREALRHVA